MVLVEHLLHSQKQSDRVVERAFDDSFVGIASDSRERQSPSVAVESGRIHRHGAEHIVRVGVGHRAVEAGRILRCQRRHIRCSADITEAIAGSSEAESNALVAESAVHAADRRVVETPAGEVVERKTINIGALILVVVAADAETHDIEVIAGGVIVNVVAGAGQSHDALGLPFLIVEHAFVEEHILLVFIESRGDIGRRHLNEIKIQNPAVLDLDGQVDIVIAESRHHEHIVAGVGGVNGERAVGSRRDKDTLRIEHDTGSVDGSTRVDIHHGACHACFLRQRRQSSRQQH